MNPVLPDGILIVGVFPMLIHAPTEVLDQFAGIPTLATLRVDAPGGSMPGVTLLPARVQCVIPSALMENGVVTLPALALAARRKTASWSTDMSSFNAHDGEVVVSGFH